MIEVIGRNLVIDTENYIGFQNDNLVEKRIFKISDLDLINYDFVLDISLPDGTKNIVSLEHHIENEILYLTWKIKKEHLKCDGLINVQLRTIDNNEIVWHSEQATFYVNSSINATEFFETMPPSEFIEIEKRIIKAKNEISEIVSGINNDLSILKETKLSKTDYASPTQAGIIKLLSNGGQNRSGIVVSSTDGTAYINTDTNYGLARSGDGKVVTASANEAEILAKTQKYKPIVPSNLDFAVQSVVGQFNNLTTENKTPVGAIIELNNKIGDIFSGLDDINATITQILGV